MKKNWIYIVLFCLIILVNVLPRGREAPEARKEEPQKLFMGFKEAQEKTRSIENVLKDNLPRYLFYVSLNLAIVFLFLSGLAVDGWFIFRKRKGEEVLPRLNRANPPPWTIGEIFKILILAFTASYIFFMVLGFFVDVWENNHFRMILDTIVLDFFVLVVILCFLWKVHRGRLANLGFSRENLRKGLTCGALGYVGIIPIILIIGICVYVILNVFKIEPPPQPIVGLFLAEKNIAFIFVSSLIAAVFGPVVEEIFFRGVMYNAVKAKLGVFRAILITSVLFSFLHTHAASYFLVGFLPIAVLGAALAYLYEKTGSLIPSITLHVLNNVGSVIMVFTFKYFSNLAG